MNIEIVGVHAANKGAVLMLEAVKARLGQAFPGARLAVPMTWPTDARLAQGLWCTPARDRGALDISRLADRAPGRIRRAVGLMTADEIDVLLDASGFAYGDFWGVAKLERRLAAPLASWKRPGRKAILLPQALGPFESPGMADALRRALDRLDLAFVRDRASLAYVEAVAPGRPNVRLAPDFTNLLHPALPERLAHLAGRSFVIPNQKMLEGADDARRETYVAFLAAAVEALAASGREVNLLIHEGRGDERLAEAANARLAAPVPVVNEPSPLDTKAIIGAADVLVSSRFHGLVSALSAGTPSLACGWSHKYLELMGDYGAGEHVVDFQARETWTPKLDALLRDAGDPAFRARLAAAAETQRARSEAMWDEVFAVLGEGG